MSALETVVWGVTAEDLDQYLASAGWVAAPEQRHTVEENLGAILSEGLGDALYAACSDYVDEWDAAIDTDEA
jgi:hypothetical protein